MPIIKGFNKYKILGKTTVIYIKSRRGSFEAKIDTEDLQKLIELDYCWHVGYCRTRKDYYVKTNVSTDKNKTGKTTLKLQTVIMNAKNSIIVDHKNGNTFDYRKRNLRFTNRSNNAKNRSRINCNNKSGYRNVCWIDGWWRIQLQIDGKNHLFPEKFSDIDEAGKFAEKMRQKYYGTFAGLS